VYDNRPIFFAVRIGSVKYFADAANQKPWAASNPVQRGESALYGFRTQADVCFLLVCEQTCCTMDRLERKKRLGSRNT
jgi:hypothetical protein